MKKINFMLLLVFLTNYCSYAQDAKTDSLNAVIIESSNESVVDSLIELGIAKLNSDPKAALEIFAEAKKRSAKLKYINGLAHTYHQAGNAFYFSSDYVMALEEWKAAEGYYSELNDLSGVANMLSNSGAIFYNQNEPDQALGLYLKALAIAEKIADKKRIATIQQNIGALHTEMKAYDLALEAYLTALQLFKEVNYTEGIGLTSMNAGVIYSEKGMVNRAMELFLEAMEHLRSTSYFRGLLREIGKANIASGNFSKGILYLDSAYTYASDAEDNYETALSLNALANAYKDDNHINGAIQYFEESKKIALQIDKSNTALEKATAGLVQLYVSKNNFSEAYENQHLLQSVRDNKYNLQTEKKFSALLFNFELEKKEVEIELLAKDQELQAKELKRQRELRNGVTGGFLIVCIFAITVFVQRNKIKAGKEQSDELLLNILPEEVAAELKATGEAQAQLIEQVTVLFTDFKGFTQMSEKLTPKALVTDLHECFSAFDEICEKFGIEKIKTIGDAYMAAGGLPTPSKDHAEKVILAALEMRDFVEAGKQRKITNNLPYFEIRIGVHTGPVVAGIVGIKKFSYDIWGDTVNTASRMESSGEVGKVNISEATHALVKDQFDSEYRGEIEAKGKGKVKMFFVLVKDQ